MKEKLIRKAKELGFADVKIVSAEPTAVIGYPHETDPAALLPGARRVVVLFWAYGKPRRPSRRENIVLSPYYLESNRSYHKARELTAWMQEQGMRALHTDRISARLMALRSGSFTGRNALYVHPALGTFCILHTVICAEELAIDPPQPPIRRLCDSCGRCERACPVGAIAKGELNKNCLRRRMGRNPVDEEVRLKVFQLLGCERCQEVCPYNRDVPVADTPEYPVADILNRRAMKDLQRVAGRNMARTNIVLAQTLAYAASRGIPIAEETLAVLEIDPLLSEMARWARRQQENRTKPDD